MHATMPTKQRLWIFKFCSLSDFSEKKLGTFQIGRVLTFIHTVCICLVMPRNCHCGFSKAVTRDFHVFIRKKCQICGTSKKWAYFISCQLRGFLPAGNFS